MANPWELMAEQFACSGNADDISLKLLFNKVLSMQFDFFFFETFTCIYSIDEGNETCTNSHLQNSLLFC